MRPRRREPDDDEHLVAERLRRVVGPGRGWVPGDEPPETHGEPALPDEPEEAEASWAPPPARTPLAGLLPETVRGGRLDPGRQGAAALLVVALVASLAAGAVVLRGRPQAVVVPEVAVPGEPLPGASPDASPNGEVVVSVGGLVARPGLVRLPAGSRVDDALRAAGGLAPGAEPGLLNLARKLVDGEQVLVGVEPPPGAPAAAAAGGLVDLNAASEADLLELPGIGPVLAERVVAWRTENGGFRSVDQLREVPGIGESKYAALKSKVTV